MCCNQNTVSRHASPGTTPRWNQTDCFPQVRTHLTRTISCGALHVWKNSGQYPDLTSPGVHMWKWQQRQYNHSHPDSRLWSSFAMFTSHLSTDSFQINSASSSDSYPTIFFLLSKCTCVNYQLSSVSIIILEQQQKRGWMERWESVPFVAYLQKSYCSRRTGRNLT